MSKIFITGGDGLIGSKLVNTLQEIGKEVEIYSHKLHGDIRDIKLNTIYDYIIHLASTTHNYHILDKSTIDAETNIIGTQHLLNEMVRTGNKNLIFASTWFVNNGNPRGLYGASKLCAEHYCKTYSSVYDLNVIITRFSNVYGEYHSNDYKRGFLNQLIWSCVNENPLEIYHESQTHYRRYLHVDDLTRALSLLTISPIKNVKQFDICSPEKTTNLQLINLINKLATKYDISKIDYMKLNVPEFHKQVGLDECQMGHQLIYDMVGWSPQIDLEEGLERLIKFYIGLKNE